MLQIAVTKTPKKKAKKKPRKPGRHKLRNRLIKMIVEGKVKPGAQLVQSHLAKRFDVSLSLMREALLDLQMYGLVETDDNRGIFVRSFDEKALLDIIDVREALEGMAARLCCGKISKTEVAELRKKIDQMCAYAEKGQHKERADVDREFHDLIYEICDNQSIRSLTRQCYLFGKLVSTDADPDHLRRVHEKVVDAMEANDPDTAEAEARSAIQSLRERVVDRIRNRGGEGIYWLS